MPTPAATDFPESFSVAAGFSLAAATPGLETIPIHANATTPSIMRCIVPSLRLRRKTPIPLRPSDRVSPAFHAARERAVVGAARRLLLRLLRGHRPTTPVDTADDGPRGRTPPGVAGDRPDRRAERGAARRPADRAAGALAGLRRRGSAAPRTGPSADTRRRRPPTRCPPARAAPSPLPGTARRFSCVLGPPHRLAPPLRAAAQSAHAHVGWSRNHKDAMT